MSNVDRYLSRLDTIETMNKKRTFRGATEQFGEESSKTYDTAHRVLEERNRGKPAHYLSNEQAIAYATYAHAKKEGNIPEAINAAAIYEELGKPEMGISKLLHVVEVTAKRRTISTDEMGRVKRFVKHYVEKEGFIEKQSSEGLEGRVGIFIFLVLGGIALSISSLTATGNAVGNLTGTSQGLFGTLLFIVGMAGLFFYFKNK